MLNGAKKQLNIGQDWFVVLNPLKSELERNKIAKEIAKVFRLPVEEALDLVANTPIILLDNLLYATALQLKQYFRNIQADILVSNDSFLKRRCYRTVWPTPPSISFLHEVDLAQGPQKTEEKLDHEEAIQEIRSWVQTEGAVPERDAHSSNKNGFGTRHFRSLLEEEREKFLKENVGLKERGEQLRKALEKAQAESQERERALQMSQAESKHREKEIQELQTLANHAEEKYELLREEFRQTRHFFEEKLAAQEKSSAEFFRQIEERDLTNKELMQEKQALQKSFSSAKNDLQKVREEQDRTRGEWENQMAHLRREIENQKKTAEEFHAKIQNLEEGKKIVEASEARLMRELELQTQQAKRWEQKASDLEKDIRRLRESFEEQLKSWQLRLAQLEAREHDLEKARKQIRQLHAELEQREFIQKKTQVHEQLTAKETRLKQLVKHQEKLEAEIRDREEEMRKLLNEQETIEREVIEAKQTQRHLAEKLKRESVPSEHSDNSVPSSPSGALSSESRPEVFDD
ncbi:MAG TPA: hypothetical protein PLL75_01915 [Candidatus Omnitrophota bacterium]|nr:hypothetical protein [Candidatus Omnitrophota bacterium]HPS36470.1 hypothetical protein [Candidatus Omnitrophota bacterium]